MAIGEIKGRSPQPFIGGDETALVGFSLPDRLSRVVSSRNNPMMRLIRKGSLALFVLLSACAVMPDMPQRRPGEEQRLIQEAQKALDAKAYVDAIAMFQKFTSTYPQSKDYTFALQRLGESYEGLLEMEYQRRINGGESAEKVKKNFLANYGHYNCWNDEPKGLAYNRAAYKMILEQYPDSPIADEAAYRMIQWEDSYHGRPEGVLREMKQLEEIFSKYPETSFRPMILYQMAQRCQILYEMYSFSPAPDVRDAQKAQEYREKAIYLYKLTLESPDHTPYAEKAWKDLEVLQKGGRIYKFD